MSTILALFLSFAASNQIFETWERLESTTKSLVVEFSITRHDRLLQRDLEQRDCELKYLHTDDGGRFASLRITSQSDHTNRKNERPYLMNRKAFYLLDNQDKKANRFQADDGDRIRFLTQYLSPAFILLDRRKAITEFQIEVLKRDENYTYFSMKQRTLTKTIIFDGLESIVFVVINEDHPSLPKRMPRLIRIRYRDEEITYDFKSWQFNEVEIDPAEFLKPEDRPAWKTQTPFAINLLKLFEKK